MTVVLPAEHKARFYSSPNLKDWTLLSEFGPQGYTGANWECPFLIQLPVEGTNEKKWALVISAAGGERGVFEQYFIGDFDGREFKNDNPADKVLTLDYGDTYYAAIPWNNLPDDKKIYIGWMVPNPQPTAPWRGQMSIPRDLSLRKTQAGLRLVQKPASVIESMLDKLSHNRKYEWKNISMHNREADLYKKGEWGGNAYWLKAEIMVEPNAEAGFSIAQKKDIHGKTIHETLVAYDAARHQLYVDRSNSGGRLNEKRLKQTIDLPGRPNTIRLEILLDRSSLEVFVNDGEAALTTYIYPDEGSTNITAFSKNGNAVIQDLKIWDLSSVKQSAIHK
jgi:levanase/fructan beta-fructosidase